jgi:hypothetical protein
MSNHASGEGMFRKTVVWITVFAGALCMGLSGQMSRPRGPVIRQIDHVLIESEDPKPLFGFFADTLQLPEAWPLDNNHGAVSGGVSAGNVNLEFFRYAQEKDAVTRGIPEARYAGLAFEPYPLSDALRELRVRGIPFDPPSPYVSTLPDGSRGTLWTTVSLPSFSRPRMTIFLYEYSPVFLRVEVRRKQLGNRLALNNGGPLGLHSIREIVIYTTQLEKDREAWTLLLGSHDSPNFWRAGTGPAIRLIPGKADQIGEIVFKVKSLQQAKVFLEQHELLGAVTSKDVSLNLQDAQGLRIRVTE